MMDFDKWWEEYNSKPVLAQYKFVIDTFEKGISQESFKENDLAEVLLELKGSLEQQRRFDEIVELTTLFQTKYPKLYKKEFQYFDEFLISYHCFHNQKKQLAHSLDNFIDNPIQGIDNFVVGFKELLFHDHMDIIDRIIDKTYSTVRDSTEIIGITSREFALTKLHEHLERLYSLEKIDTKALSTFKNDLEKFDFQLTDDYLDVVKQCFENEMITGSDAVHQFQKDWKEFIKALELYFLKYMSKKNFNFALSGLLWDNIFQYWNKNVKTPRPTPNEFFSINKEKFDKYLYHLSGGMLIENSAETIATLWGSTYIYDFLTSIDIIDKTIYEDVKRSIYILKGEVFRGFSRHLWKSSFIHQWNKPDSISQKEFKTEQKIFLKSYQIQTRKSSFFISKINEEIKTIGLISGYNDELMYGLTGQKHQSKKVGRNEPCPCGSGKKYKKCCGKLA